MSSSSNSLKSKKFRNSIAMDVATSNIHSYAKRLPEFKGLVAFPVFIEMGLVFSMIPERDKKLKKIFKNG